MKKSYALFGSILALSTQMELRADDFGNVDFSLRFPATLSRLSSYADVAAKGGASAAGRYGSSINPAANAWLFPKYYEAGVSAQYSYVHFGAGNELNFFSQSATVDLHDFGTVRVSLGEIRSNDHNIRDLPIRYSYTLDGVRTEWANKIGKDVSIGVGFSFTNSDTTFGTTKFQLVEANTKLYLGRVGVLWGPAEHWILGLEADCGNNHYPQHWAGRSGQRG